MAQNGLDNESKSAPNPSSFGTEEKIYRSRRQRTLKNICNACFPDLKPPQQQRQQDPEFSSDPIPITYEKETNSDGNSQEFWSCREEGGEGEERGQVEGHQEKADSHTSSPTSSKASKPVKSRGDRGDMQSCDCGDQAEPKGEEHRRDLESGGVAGDWSTGPQAWKKKLYERWEGCEAWKGAKDGKANLTHWPKAFYPQYFFKEKPAASSCVQREGGSDGEDTVDHADAAVRQQFSGGGGIGGTGRAEGLHQSATDLSRNSKDVEEASTGATEVQGGHQEQRPDQGSGSSEEGSGRLGEIGPDGSTRSE